MLKRVRRLRRGLWSMRRVSQLVSNQDPPSGYARLIPTRESHKLDRDPNLVANAELLLTGRDLIQTVDERMRLRRRGQLWHRAGCVIPALRPGPIPSVTSRHPARRRQWGLRIRGVLWQAPSYPGYPDCRFSNRQSDSIGARWTTRCACLPMADGCCVPSNCRLASSKAAKRSSGPARYPAGRGQHRPNRGPGNAVNMRAATPPGSLGRSAHNHMQLSNSWLCLCAWSGTDIAMFSPNCPKVAVGRTVLLMSTAACPLSSWSLLLR